MSIEDGGPAFPTDNEIQTGPNTYHLTGMSLRDYFAAKAMQGHMANPNSRESAKDRAEWAYMLADAMLIARQKNTEERK